ncbi:hypothetical protein [Williamsia sp. M5A3_1d]
MTDLEPTGEDGPPVLTALGLDLDADYAVPEHLWTTALSVALDPDTPAVDPANVPIMDDHGTVPDTDDVYATEHGAHHDPTGADDTGLHDPASGGGDHVHLDHDLGEGHDDSAHDGTGHDGGHDPGAHDTGSHGTDWHG